MTNLDELYSQIPTQQIANTLGVGTGEVDAIKTPVPVLVGGLHRNAQDSDNAAKIESAVTGAHCGMRADLAIGGRRSGLAVAGASPPLSTAPGCRRDCRADARFGLARGHRPVRR